MRPQNRNEFGIAIICALTLEADAVEALFDETYDRLGKTYGKQAGDTNAYITGRIGHHNVVLCYMPSMGRSPAASVASSLRVSYTGVQLALVVGICGGAPYPSSSQQIFLGDVIISDSVIQYDFGRQYPGGFQRKTSVKDTLGRPSQEIRSLLASLKAKRARLELKEEVSQYLHTMQQSEPDWQCPASDDTLFDCSFAHKHRSQTIPSTCLCFDEGQPGAICPEASETSCNILSCDERHIVRRRSRTDTVSPSVHIGAIACADTVMKSGEDRDRIVRSERVLGFEMEGAGVWDNIPCIIVKGVCDYADSHKSKEWQDYAAAVGASAAKAFLSAWNPALREDPFIVRLDTAGMPRLPFFIGRTKELRELQTTLLRGGIFNRIVTLQGPPGIGKSSLALKYVEENHDYYSAIFWLDASSPLHLASSFTKVREHIDKESHFSDPMERLNNGFLSLKQLLKRYSSRDQSTGLWKACAASEDVQAVQRWLSRRKNNRWLLVFDDYRSSADSSNDEEGRLVERFFTESRQGHMIITTQSPLTAWVKIRLGKMKCINEGFEILSRVSERQDITEDPHVMELVAQMDGLPLALVAAGSYLSEIHISCSAYLDRHKNTWAQVQQETPQLTFYNGNLHSCWVIAFDELTSSPDVRMIFKYWSFFDSQDVWFELLAWNENDRNDFYRAMKLLCNYGIAEMRSGPPDEGIGSCGYNMQRSFHAWLANRLGDNVPNDINRALVAVKGCSKALIESGKYYKGLLRLLPHTNRCFDFIVGQKTGHHRSKDELYDDTDNLIHLATSFQFAGYGKTKHYARYMAMMHLENPGKVHFIKSERLLLWALRNLEQVDTIEGDTETHGDMMHQEIIQRFKLLVLHILRVVYMYMSDNQKVDSTSRRIVNVLQQLPNAHQEARGEQSSLLFNYYYSIVFRCGISILFILMILILGEKFEFMLNKDTAHELLIFTESVFMSCSWAAFMQGWRDRRKTFALYVLSSVIFEGHQRYDHGPPSFDLMGIPQIAMALSTLPILYYEVLH